MYIEIDFNSDEAIYNQLCDQIIMGIAAARLCDGDPLPSVRQLADDIGINMHTVNKAYTVLKQEGFVKVDRRRGVIIAVNTDKLRALAETKEYLEEDDEADSYEEESGAARDRLTMQKVMKNVDYREVETDFSDEDMDGLFDDDDDMEYSFISSTRRK